jgi:hypothetical protein
LDNRQHDDNMIPARAYETRVANVGCSLPQSQRSTGWRYQMPGSACFVLLAATVVLNASGAMAQAQSFPTRPVTLIVPWPAGGTTDVAVRALAKATERHLGQPIVVENRAGASGTLGPMHMAATEKPDGYTLAQIPLSLLRASLLTKTTFEPTKDLTYVIGLAELFLYGTWTRLVPLIDLNSSPAKW